MGSFDSVGPGRFGVEGVDFDDSVVGGSSKKRGDIKAGQLVKDTIVHQLAGRAGQRVLAQIVQDRWAGGVGPRPLSLLIIN